MIKNITIYDYAGNPTNISIENFEDVIRIDCIMLTGDEVLKVSYKNGDQKIFDSCPNGRVMDVYDGEARVPLNQVDKISEIEHPLDLLEYLWDLNQKK